MNNNYIKVKIEGKNVNNFIKWLIYQKINIFQLKKISYKELTIVIKEKDYKCLLEYSKNYTIKIINKYGKTKLIEILKKNNIILTCITMSIIFIFILSNLILSIDVVNNNKTISNKILKELEKYDIQKYKFKKKYSYLEEVKNNILKNMKNELEWIEINESGTKYIVKLVERKKPHLIKKHKYQSIVASKPAIIKSIKAYSGEKNKLINEYVKENEVIINGILKETDSKNIYTRAEGKVYGEVWYKLTIEYPIYYQEEFLTGKSKNVLSLFFINKKIPLFPYPKYKRFKNKLNPILENNIIPINLYKEKLYEVKIQERIYTEDEAILKAIELTKQRMLAKNNKITKFNNFIILSKELKKSGIKLEIFASTIEDITKIVEIKEEKVE